MSASIACALSSGHLNDFIRTVSSRCHILSRLALLHSRTAIPNTLPTQALPPALPDVASLGSKLLPPPCVQPMLAAVCDYSWVPLCRIWTQCTIKLILASYCVCDRMLFWSHVLSGARPSDKLIAIFMICVTTFTLSALNAVENTVSKLTLQEVFHPSFPQGHSFPTYVLQSASGKFVSQFCLA